MSPEEAQRAGTPLLQSQVVASLEKRRLWEDLLVSFQYLKGLLKAGGGGGGGLFVRGCSDREGGNGFKLTKNLK